MPDNEVGQLETVEAFLEAFAAMDLDRALSFLADDVEYTNIPIGTVRGHAGAREVLEPFFAGIHENEFLILRKAASGSGGVPRAPGPPPARSWVAGATGQQRLRGARRQDHRLA